MKKENYIGKYYGWKKIVDVISVEEDANVLVVFEDDKKKKEEMMISLVLLDKFITQDKVDPTEFRSRVALPIIEEILKVLLKYQVRIEWIDYIFQTTAQSVNQSIMKAEKKFWGKEIYDRTFFDVDNVLKQKNE